MKKASDVKAYVKLVRPIQWLKNLMLFYPPFLGGEIINCLNFSSLIPFASFCMVSSASYIINDCRDKENDSHHPEKKHRPIVAGQISLVSAYTLVLILLISGFASATTVSTLFLGYLGLYLLVSLAYTFSLKNHVLLDIFSISAGFMIRLKAGGVAFDVAISEWLFLCVFLLSLFLSAGKRLSEKRRLGGNAGFHRKVLGKYPKGFLEGVMIMTGGSVLVTYTLYVISKQSHLLLYTVPLCAFGLLRYTLRVQKGDSNGDPTESLTRDIPLLLTGGTWALMVGWGIYG